MNRSILNKITALCVLMAGVGTSAAVAGVLTGTIKDDHGKVMRGVMVRVTDDISGVSEAVFSDAQGVYQLSTQLQGTLKLRARTPYFRDARATVELGGQSVSTEDIVMQPMTSDEEISESLPAAYHFGALPFETGDDANFNRFQFQRDCLSCHQMGNPFTRQVRTAESWSVTIQRMHRMVGNFDADLRDERSVILAEGFDGKPIEVRPVFPLDDALDTAKIYEYRLERAFVPHDSIVHPTNGLIYTVDQALDHMVVTDPVTGQSEYILQSDGDAMKYVEGNPNDGTRQIGLFNPTDRHGPHSLDLGKDGKYYVTNAGSTSIGVFNPETNAWEPSHKIPRESGAFYPHTIRVDQKGYVWFTLAGSEKVGRLDPKNGAFEIISLPDVKSNGISGGTQPYGIDINPVDDVMWYGRLFGDKIGKVDPKTLETTEYDSPVRGPRRMHFDKEGILWVTGYSEGELARIDVADGFTSKVYVMPEFADGYRPAPYALGVHPLTQDIWLNENMTDRIYRFIPKEERFIAYPVPLSGTYTRDMTFAADGKVCLSNNPIPPPALEGGVLEIICLDPDYDPKAKAGVQLSKN
ncbi:MAG: carboxypeptidase regulatory-like domain-containing protein [Proteobacteria bacterium]|nr:carboxypeptidase regulatory-like domain-containing protein [Pseudomonadota bacterium]